MGMGLDRTVDSRAHGGTIPSTRGRGGARFTFTLPLVEAASPSQAP